MGVFLGLDSSTQSLSALAVDTDTREVVLSESVNFGKSLSEFDSPHGFLEDENPQRKHSNPLMWVKALDVLFAAIRAKGFDLGRVNGISGAGQQHGSVYLRESLSGRRWSTSTPLADQVKPLLSRDTAPIWMDSSTSQECREIAASVGGDERVVAISGSRAIERFTGPQIRKFWQGRARALRGHEADPPGELLHRVAPRGRNRGHRLRRRRGHEPCSISRRAWSGPLLEATAPGLASRLPPLVACTTRVGTIDPYFVEKYGFAAGTPVIAFYRRQPEQPGRYGSDRAWNRGGQPRDERHRVRGHA